MELLMFMGHKNYVPQPAPVWDLNIQKEQTLFSYNQQFPGLPNLANLFGEQKTADVALEFLAIFSLNSDFLDMIQHNYFWFVAQAKAMFLFCNHALITKVSTLLDIYKGCQRRQVQNQMGHIQISITTKIIIFLKSGRKTFKTIFCALSITEKYINLVNILRKKRASPLQV